MPSLRFFLSSSLILSSRGYLGFPTKMYTLNVSMRAAGPARLISLALITSVLGGKASFTVPYHVFFFILLLLHIL